MTPVPAAEKNAPANDRGGSDIMHEYLKRERRRPQ